jgi:hypothetical protein
MARTGSGGVDFDDVEWWNPKKPTQIGQTTESTIRIMPRWDGQETRPYWHKVQRHFSTIELDDGRRKRLPRVCPLHNVPEGHVGTPCPQCERRERAERVGDKTTADALKPRSRFYLNIIDAEDQQSHFKTDPSTGSIICRTKAYGIGGGLLKKINMIVGSKGPIFDRNIGRYIKIYATKTGKEDRDVRYDAMDCSDSCPLPQGFEQVEMLPLDQLDVARDYAAMAKEIANTYPDAAGVPMQAPQAGYQQPTAQPPYANPYQQPAPQAPAQGPQMALPQQASAPQGYQQAPQQYQQPPVQPPSAPQQGYQAPLPPQHQAPAAPPVAPPGWQLVNGQWVQTQQAAPQPQPAQAAPQYAPPQQALPQTPAQQAPAQAPQQSPPGTPGVGPDGVPF